MRDVVFVLAGLMLLTVSADRFVLGAVRVATYRVKRHEGANLLGAFVIATVLSL